MELNDIPKARAFGGMVHETMSIGVVERSPDIEVPDTVDEGSIPARL
jgi:hypothetical protein